MATRYYALVAGTGAFGGLSVWQLNRFFWKKDLLEARARAMEAEPLKDLPAVPPPDICRVELTGSFYDDDYVLVELREPLHSTLGSIDEKAACMVFVPFITRDNKHVMVNKGQVPASLARDPERLREVLRHWPANTTVQGVFRKNKRKNPRAVDARMDARRYKLPHPELMWTDWYDRHGIAEGARAPLPYWVDVTDQPFDAPPLTRARQEYVSHVITPAVHMVYFATWTTAFLFSLWAFRRHGNRLFKRAMNTPEQLRGETDARMGHA
eukprot:TRINITY_DN65073_c0_g1_i1.p1 TRINITY_DN65073_c0_g1~~TRINITY_DN65073_c0_g1_i1.p1  ORF type:complete len:295 (+),score=83.50 TRINITY_DN65073_c0_g1_i1:82-885(+)